MKRKWEISDLDGSNKRTVTLVQFRAEIEALAARPPRLLAQRTTTKGLASS